MKYIEKLIRNQKETKNETREKLISKNNRKILASQTKQNKILPNMYYFPRLFHYFIPLFQASSFFCLFFSSF